MKASAYNFFFPYEADDTKVVAYNSFSNALALVGRDKYKIFKRFDEEGLPIEDDMLVQQLKAGCFLIEDDANELDRLRLRMLQGRFNTDSLNLTIAPTANCNFRCSYCYEKDVIAPSYLTPEIEKAIVAIVRGRVKSISSLSITWYGGEPLMHMDSVDRLSREFISLCNENNINYYAMMITNGYLLTRENLKMINELKINTIQITLDGCEDTHNKRRPLEDGSGTFQTIIANLKENKDLLPHIPLRVNIDKNNSDAWEEIVAILHDNGLSDKVKPHLGKIIPDTGSTDKASCFDCGGFSSEVLRFFNDKRNEDSYMSNYPAPKSFFCGADNQSSLVIGADGRLYKCWMDIGSDSGCVGSLVDKADANEKLYLGYMLYDPTTHEECSKCKLMPICMSGCPYKVQKENNEKCSIYKYALEEFMSIIANKLKQKKKHP